MDNQCKPCQHRVVHMRLKTADSVQLCAIRRADAEDVNQNPADLTVMNLNSSRDTWIIALPEMQAMHLHHNPHMVAMDTYRNPIKTRKPPSLRESKRSE